MTDQFLAEAFKQSPLVILLVGILIFGFRYFRGEVKAEKAAHEATRAELRERNLYLIETATPALVRAVDATTAATQVLADTRAELREERNRRST